MATRKKIKPVGGLVPARDRQIVKESLGKFGLRNMGTYAFETNLERALPDLFDGMKPVQRRVAYAMLHTANTEFVKSARIVGDTLGKYHPHGDSSVYGAMVTMSHFPTPVLLGKGNWGNMVDNAAAYRYTNARLSQFGRTFFDPDYIHREVTSFVPNYDDKDVEPISLPAQLPYVLMAPNEGTGVGITGKLPAFTAESIIEVLTRLLQGEKLQAADFAKTLKFANKWGGVLLNTPESKAQWLRMFKEPEANLKFVSDMQVDTAKKRIIISDWPIGSNPMKFIESVRAMKETLRAQTSKGSSTVTIICKPDYNLPQFEAYVKRVHRLTQKTWAVKMNVTVRKAQVNDGVVDYVNKVEAMSVPQMLVAWLRMRIDLELRSLAYRQRKQEQAIAYSELLIFVSSKLDVLFKALKTSDPDAYLVKALKLTPEQAKQVLDLPTRRWSRMDQADLKTKLKEQQAFLRQLQAWTKAPRKKVLAGLPAILDAIKKDRAFKVQVAEQKLKMV